MTNMMLMNIAIANAKSVSLNEHRDEIVYLYYSKELTEYTAVPEKNVEILLKGEPNLSLIAKYRNGEVIK